MHIENNITIKLKSYKGTLFPQDKVYERENYWKLIGQKGKVIDAVENHDGRVLVLFDRNLDEFEVENHNPIKNSLLIRKTDLEIETE